jgi:transposase
MREKRKFTPEFRKEATNLVLEQGLSTKQAAVDLNIGMSTLSKWLTARRDEANDPNALSENEKDELKRLRKENRILRMERDLLKKTTVYFAKTTQDGVIS